MKILSGVPSSQLSSSSFPDSIFAATVTRCVPALIDQNVVTITQNEVPNIGPTTSQPLVCLRVRRNSSLFSHKKVEFIRMSRPQPRYTKNGTRHSQL